MDTVFITGANRGIGLEFTRQYLESGSRVIPTARNPDDATELYDLRSDFKSRLSVYQLDVTDDDSIEKTYEQVKTDYDGIDVLINNAGIMGSKESFESLSDRDLRTVFETNCLGVFRVTQQFLPLVESASGKVIFITSLMGSIEDNGIGGSYPYRISKASLNMLGRTLSRDYADSGMKFLLLHPGWVKTRMGGEDAKITKEASVSGMRSVIDELDREMSGEFYNYEGEQKPW